MSEKLNISPFEQELKQQFSNLEVPAPDGVWSGMEGQLDQLNQDLQFDKQIKQDLGQAQVNPPSSVWQGIQSGLGTGSAGIGASVVGKWVLGVLVAGSVTYGTYALLQDNDTQDRSAVRERKEEIIPAKPEMEPELQDEVPPEQVKSEDAEQKRTSQADLATGKGNESPLSVGSDQGTGSSVRNGSEGTAGAVNNSLENDRPVTGESAGNTGKENSGSGNTNPGEHEPGVDRIPTLFLLSQERDTGVCAGSMIHYPSRGGNYTELQVLADGQLIKKLKPQQKIEFKLDPGQYQVEFRAFYGENIASTRRFIKVHDVPKMAFVHDNTGEGMDLFRKTSGNAMQFAWFVDGGYASRNNEMEYRFFDQVPTEHRISLHGVNGFGCRDSVVQQIRNTHTVKVGIANPIPNIFTPNGDGVNDVYIIPADGVTSWNLVILDRAGKIVFQTTDPAKFWDGTNMFNGQTCGEGLYSYQLRYALAGGEVQKASGTISLKREQ